MVAHDTYTEIEHTAKDHAGLIGIVSSWAFPAFPAGSYAGDQTGYCNYLSCYTTDAPAQIKMPACTIKKVRINILTNTLIGDSTITLRKNGVDTGLTGVILAGGTGQYEFTGSVAFAEGDLMSISFVMGANAAKVIGVYGGTVVMEA